MAFHRCTIHEEDGTAIADVTVTVVEVEERGGAWHGTISMTHVVNLTAGQYYRMVLDDGRVGDFLVRRNTSAGGEDRAVAIHGKGPLK